MAVQLIIDGQHITDVLAQVHALANATSSDPVPSQGKVFATSAVHEAVSRGETVVVAPVKSVPAKSTSTAAPSAGGKTEAKADDKLTREEQDAAVASMIDNGEKDDRYEQLTKGRQKAVDDGIAAKAAPAADKAEDDLNDMFGDDEAEKAPEVTAQTIRDMMGALGKDAAGNPVQDNLLKIRDILTKFVTKGAEIKVGNIPADKLTAVYAELKKLEA